MSDYRRFVVEAVETLIEKQSTRLGGAPFGTLCLTNPGLVNRPYDSLGGRTGSTLWTCYIAERKPGHKSTSMDFESWSVLEKLARRTGDRRYADLLDGMVGVFADYGFDPRSGLGYFGAMTDFDVRNMGPAPYYAADFPGFKFTSDMPYELLWRRTPEKMDRMFKAVFPGLFTRPETMDFNRYCYYGFEMPRTTPTLEFDPGHVAFAGAAAAILHAWAFHYARTGDTDSLQLATRLTAKWLPLQNRATGLLPHMCSAKVVGETDMTVQNYSGAGECWTAIELLDAAELLRSRPAPGGGESLAAQLHALGHGLMAGMARFAYDERCGIFPSWLKLADGSAETEAYIYCFDSQDQKDRWVKDNPKLATVNVYPGHGFYGGGPWSYHAGAQCPLYLARAAQITGDKNLVSTATRWGTLIMNVASKLTGPFNDQQQWTFTASASYIRMFVILHRLTGDETMLKHARALADMELGFLARPLPEDQLPWWHMPFRAGLLEALLELDEALAA